MVVYQPQPKSFQDDKISGEAAVSVTLKGTSSLRLRSGLVRRPGRGGSRYTHGKDRQCDGDEGQISKLGSGG